MDGSLIFFRKDISENISFIVFISIVGLLLYNTGYWMMVAPEYFQLHHIVMGFNAESLKIAIPLLILSLVIILFNSYISKALLSVYSFFDKEEPVEGKFHTGTFIVKLLLLIGWGIFITFFLYETSPDPIDYYIDTILRARNIIDIFMIFSVIPIIFSPILFIPRTSSIKNNSFKISVCVVMFCGGLLIGKFKSSWGVHFLIFGTSAVYHDIPDIGSCISLGNLDSMIFLKSIEDNMIYQCEYKIPIETCVRRNIKYGMVMVTKLENHRYDSIPYVFRTSLLEAREESLLIDKELGEIAYVIFKNREIAMSSPSHENTDQDNDRIKSKLKELEHRSNINNEKIKKIKRNIHIEKLSMVIEHHNVKTVKEKLLDAFNKLGLPNDQINSHIPKY